MYQNCSRCIEIANSIFNISNVYMLARDENSHILWSFAAQDLLYLHNKVSASLFLSGRGNIPSKINRCKLT